MKKFSYIPIIMMAGILSGCGDGGSSPDTTASNPQPSSRRDSYTASQQTKSSKRSTDIKIKICSVTLSNTVTCDDKQQPLQLEVQENKLRVIVRSNRDLDGAQIAFEETGGNRRSWVDNLQKNTYIEGYRWNVYIPLDGVSESLEGKLIFTYRFKGEDKQYIANVKILTNTTPDKQSVASSMPLYIDSLVEVIEKIKKSMLELKDTNNSYNSIAIKAIEDLIENLRNLKNVDGSSFNEKREFDALVSTLLVTLDLQDHRNTYEALRQLKKYIIRAVIENGVTVLEDIKNSLSWYNSMDQKQGEHIKTVVSNSLSIARVLSDQSGEISNKETTLTEIIKYFEDFLQKKGVQKTEISECLDRLTNLEKFLQEISALEMLS